MAQLTPEQQKALALAKARQRQAQAQQAQQAPQTSFMGGGAPRTDGRNPLSDFAQGLGAGVSDVLGIPGDVSNWLLKKAGVESAQQATAPTGGSQWWEQGFRRLGMAPEPGQQPQGAAGRIGEAMGQMVVPAAGATAGLASRGAGLLTNSAIRAGDAGRVVGMLDDLGRAAAQHPGRFLTTEVAGAGGAQAGLEVGKQEYPDSPGMQALGEILGGVATTTSPSGAARGLMAIGRGASHISPLATVGKMAKNKVVGHKPGAGNRQASERVQGAARDLKAASDQFRNGDVIAERLTPAQRTGDQGLMNLERSAMDENPKLAGQIEQQRSAANAANRQDIRDIGGGGDTSAAAQELQRRRDELTQRLDQRAQQAAQTAQQRLQELGPNVDVEQANTIVRNELEGAYRAARQEESQLWSAVPKDAQVPRTNLEDAYTRLGSQLSSSQQEDMPAALRRYMTRSEDAGDEPIQFLDSRGNPIISDAPQGPGTDTVQELQGLRSKLLEEARQARANGEANKARIAGDAADAILQDLGAGANVDGPVGAAMRTALGYSRQLNDKFTRGAVGKLLRTDSRGGESVPAGQTLERALGRGGYQGRDSDRAILQAVADTGNPQATDAAVGDFIRSKIMQEAVKRDGTLDTNKVAALLKDNRYGPLLADRPQLRGQIEQAMRAGDAATLFGNRAASARDAFMNPNKSRAAIFLKGVGDGNVDTAIERTLGSQNPAQAMDQIVRQLRKDQSGEALKGLKTAFGDYLERNARSNRLDDSGEPYLSGAKLRELTRSPKVRRAMARLYTPQEMARLDTIANTAWQIERSLGAESAGKAMPGGLSEMKATLASMLGAKVGSEASRATGVGSGASLVLAGRFSKAARNLVDRAFNDPAERALLESITNPGLFRDLMTNITAGGPRARKSRAQLNAWLATVPGYSPDEGGDQQAQ